MLRRCASLDVPHIMCSSSLHGTDVSDTGLYFSAACLSPFWNIQDTYLRLASHLEVNHGLLNFGIYDG
jgi:hypothetical protein